MRVHVGTDVVLVPRLAASLADTRFVERSYTPHERAYCSSRPERYAARWAAKEATMKALGRGLGEISMLDIEVWSEKGVAPELRLSGRARRVAQEAGWSTVSVSISHDGDYAIATIVAVSSAARDLPVGSSGASG